MLSFQELIPLGPKTTMRIGGKARLYADLHTKQDAEEASAFAEEQNIPLIVLGAGSNTIFDDGMIEALVVRILACNVSIQPAKLQATSYKLQANIHVEAGKNLPQLINELAEEGLDLSPLTGIPGTVGGAIFGNAGQGYGGVWIGEYVKEVEALTSCKLGAGSWEQQDRATWKRLLAQDCAFGYRTSVFKTVLTAYSSQLTAPLLWSATLSIPSRPKEEIKAEIERLLKKRIETQPHVKTAGSCFLSLSDGTPAWKVIDAAGLRGKKIGKVQISPKHANFLIAEKGASFTEAEQLVKEVQNLVGTSGRAPLHVEMRFVKSDGSLAF